MRALFIFLLLLTLALPVRAQVAEPVNIEADVLEFRQQEKIYVARGNAVITQDGVTVRANILTAAYVEGAEGKTTFTRLTAEGNVHISSEKGEVFGDRGVYEVARQVAVLKGNNLRLVTPTDEVTAAESLEFWQKENLAVARGQAVARRDNNRIAADTLTAALARNGEKQMEIRRVGAQGHVMVSTPQEIVRGERGVYDAVRQVATLEGNVRITRGENQLNGERAEVNMATGVSRLLAASGQRVRGLILPKDAPEVP